MTEYACPEILVSTEWVDAHLDDPSVRVVEVDVSPVTYDLGHIPGAVAWDWTTDLCDEVRRDILTPDRFEQLMARSGIGNDTTVIVYGDNDNWFACWALWQMKIYGHRDVRVMNGGHRKWTAEGRIRTGDVPSVKETSYTAAPPDNSLRAWLADVLHAVEAGDVSLVDVRGADEFHGVITAPAGVPEGAQRAGHIPGAVHVPWASACLDDGTYKSADALLALFAAKGVRPDRPVITYCRIGERSSYTWFVLKYLLGFPDARNYDGSWVEWGNVVGVPIERG
jgi:thiosulfate/3-mercaptopyruvate sulfurtransferase